MKSKNFINYLFILFGAPIVILAQQKIKSGEYQMKMPFGSEQIYLQVDENQNFEMVYLKGKFISENNKIKFELKNAPKPIFQVNKIAETSKESELKIKFSSMTLAYIHSLYYKTDLLDEYQPVNSLLNYNEDYSSASLIIPKPNILYVLYYTEGAKSQEGQIVIPNDVNAIELVVNYDIYEPFSNLEVVQDPLQSDQIILMDGMEPIVFSLNPPIEESNENQLEVSINEVKNFKPVQEGIDDEYQVVEMEENTTPNGFKFKEYANLKEAIQDIESNDKFLVVSYVKKDPEFEIQYKELLKQQENYFQYYSEEELDTYQKFEHYLLKKDEDALLKKHKIKGDKAVLVLNEQGEVLYSAERDFIEESENFSIYSTINSQLTQAQAQYEIDQLAQNNKLNEDTFIQALHNITTLPSNSVATDAVVVEEVDAIGNTNTGKFYSLKTSENQIYKLWNAVLTSNLKIDSLNNDLAQIIKNELNNNGFTNKLFNKSILSLRPCDRLSIDYLLKFKDSIKVRDDDAYTNYDENYNWTNVLTLIDNFIYDLNSKQTDEKEKQPLLDYLYSLLVKSNYDYDFTNSYLNALDANENLKKTNYHTVFEEFYNANFNDKSSWIEQLDKLYSKGYSPENAIDWTSFKYNFSNMANNAAWQVVTEANAKNYLKQAIKWSETSNVISKDNGYFLDTLAQLYYQNGQRELAIQTQEKALSNVREIDDPGTYREIKDVLMKMKAGTY